MCGDPTITDQRRPRSGMATASTYSTRSLAYREIVSTNTGGIFLPGGTRQIPKTSCLSRRTESTYPVERSALCNPTLGSHIPPLRTSEHNPRTTRNRTPECIAGTAKTKPSARKAFIGREPVFTFALSLGPDNEPRLPVRTFPADDTETGLT